MTKTKLAPKSVRSKKKVSCHSTFYVGSKIRDEKIFGSGMRKMVGSGRKLPGSATLVPVPPVGILS
jgi:hypothetical protein